ncbi:MAG TPA: DivIVA domain-containing protein [Acidimicrobiales bacterium]|nr:DivIVA domain-containing protein [Acidimicrobiales bacterium]
MELTPQTLHAVEFREARRGGYNTRDVDDFLERVAAGVGQLHERLRDLAARADTAEARLLDTQRQFEELQRRPPAAAPAAPAPAPRINETDDTLRRTLVLAQRTADATIKEAKQEASRLLEEARAEANRTRAAAEDEARRGADHTRASIEAELDSLVNQRDALTADIVVLNQHIDDQRERIRAGIDELRRILDDESRLVPAPVPPLADVDRPPAPTLPSRGAFVPPPPPGPAPEPTEGPVADAASPFALGPPGTGAHVAAFQESPQPEGEPPPQPMPFTTPGDARGPWLPSELRTSVGDEPPDPQANGTDAPDDTEGRPSEWGRAVFDPQTPDTDRSNFG